MERQVSREIRDKSVGFTLEQACLNIEARTRTSRLPWRGQFSPELIEHLIDRVCPDSRRFLDPFCGSGTVLYEALHKGRVAIGAEVNPAAWHLAALASFVTLPTIERQFALAKVRKIASDLGFVGSPGIGSTDCAGQLLQLVKCEAHPFIRKALAAVVLLGMGDLDELSTEAIARGGFAVNTLLNGLKGLSGTVECHLADARVLPLADASVDAVITSPPYINVFNYHQNYRSAAELLGWSPLEGARSEIGANRKHRSNRFLTVIQYSLDMAQSLAELSRVMQPGTPLVIVLGRTSNVLGAAFENGAMVIDLLERSGSFEIVRRAERCFTNRYGDQIYEDILIARCIRHEVAQLEAARNIGIAALLNNIGTVCNKNRAALESAIARAPQVRPSPMLTISVPPPFIEHSSSTAIAHAGN